MRREAKANPMTPTYDRLTIWLHWATVALVVALWIVGQTGDWLPRGPLQTNYWSMHIVFGFTLAVVLAWRAVWRLTGGRRLPPVGPPLLQALAKTVHYLLYALMAAVVVLGIVNAFVRGYNLFDLTHLPQIGDRALRRPITDWHGLLANILLALAALHALAALAHRAVLRDGVLRRMMPWLKPAAERPVTLAPR
jgi:cytochrome b561